MVEKSHRRSDFSLGVPKHGSWLALVALVLVSACPISKGPLPPETKASSLTPGPLSPLTVSWEQKSTSELRRSLNKGIVAVSYSGGNLTIVEQCNLEESYVFASARREYAHISKATDSDLYQDMPWAGSTSPGSITHSGDMTLVIVAIQSGLMKMPTRSIYRESLPPECEGATHVVTAARIGAYAIATAPANDVKSPDDLFGSTPEGSDSAATHYAASGNRDACDTRIPSVPPEECAMPIQIYLTKIRDDHDPEHALTIQFADGEEIWLAYCPNDIQEQGPCSMQGVEIAGKCIVGDMSQCEAACNEYEYGRICAVLGARYMLGEKGVPVNIEKAAEYFEKGCPDYEMACVAAATLWFGGSGHERNEQKALSFPIERACNNEYGLGCTLLGKWMNESGEKEAAGDLLLRGCQYGDANGCGLYGIWILDNRSEFKYVPGRKEPGFPPDYLRDACDGGVAFGCNKLAELHLNWGDWPEAKSSLAMSYLRKSCYELKDSEGCNVLARLMFGCEVQQDPNEGVRIHADACALGSTNSCIIYAVNLCTGKYVDKDKGECERILEYVCRNERVDLACEFLEQHSRGFIINMDAEDCDAVLLKKEASSR